MRYTGPKTKQARRIGEALREKDLKYLTKRSYPPGMHGAAGRRKSEYGIELSEKQKAKWIYGLTERQFRRYVEKSSQRRELTGNMLLQFLESRLDNVVYRLGFATSRAQARQLVNHGFFHVNGRKVNIPSYEVKPGDTIAVAAHKRNSKYIQTRSLYLKEFKPQEWLSADLKNLSGQVLNKPTPKNTGSTIQMDTIIEFYSR